MKVGIHSESVAQDARLYAAILRGVVDHPIDVETGAPHRGGWLNALKDLRPLLDTFARKGIELAIVAVDHDAPPRHLPAHRNLPLLDGSCKTCNLEERVRYGADGAPRDRPRVAVAVPAPAIESWLLATQDPSRAAVEELPRRQAKVLLYGTPKPGRRRVLKVGLPLAEQLGNDEATRDRVAATCASFADFLHSLERALAGG